MYCARCGAKNPEKAKFCQKCGARLTYEVSGRGGFLDKVPGFRSRSPWKMVLASFGYVLIAVLAIYIISCLLVDVDVSLTVNSAYALDSVVNNTPNNDRFIVMNVTVKNNGKDPIRVYASDFSLLRENEYMDYSNFYGQGTDIPESVEIPGGESRSFLLVFDVEGSPEIIEYTSILDPLSEPKNAGIGSIKTIPSPGIYANYKWDGTVNNKTYSLKGNVTYRNATAGNIEEVIERSGETIWLSSEVYREPIASQSFTFDPETLQDENGTYSSQCFFPRDALTAPGDSIPVFENGEEVGTETLEGSSTIDFMGKKVECWVTKIEGNGVRETCYYDKTTGLLLKVVGTEKGSAYGVSYTGSYTILLENANIPIIGLQ